jgi:hypothetical protein
LSKVVLNRQLTNYSASPKGLRLTGLLRSGGLVNELQLPLQAAHGWPTIRADVQPE